MANPVFDREGRLYVTLSGSRGEKVPVSVYRIVIDGDVEPYSGEILNPTGLAWGPDDCLYVSSREDGTVYRIGANRDVEVYADELGTATGIAFDPEGILYVGDRRGTIFRIEPNGEPRSFCRLDPSVAAYHLAFDSGRQSLRLRAEPVRRSIRSTASTSTPKSKSIAAVSVDLKAWRSTARERCTSPKDSSGIAGCTGSGPRELPSASSPRPRSSASRSTKRLGMVLAGASSVYKIELDFLVAPAKRFPLPLPLPIPASNRHASCSFWHRFAFDSFGCKLEPGQGQGQGQGGLNALAVELAHELHPPARHHSPSQETLRRLARCRPRLRRLAPTHSSSSEHNRHLVPRLERLASVIAVFS